VSSDWRTRLGSFAAGIGLHRLSDDFSDDAKAPETSGEATAETSRLRRLLDDLKAGDPNAAAPSNGSPPVEAAAPAVEPVAVKQPKAEVARVTASAPVLNGERKAETAMSDDVFLLVAEQRKAAEALLLQVAELEQRLQTEAHAAQAAADYKSAKEKAEAAAILEQQASELAHTAAEHHRTVQAQRREADNLLVTTRSDAEAAKAKVTALQEQLRDARRLADQSLSALAPCEARAKELAVSEEAAQSEAAEAAAGVTACQSARARAEKEAEDAQKRAETLKSEIAELAGRIAQQAAEVTRSREAIASAK
jgi:chromosome segregation ATPase